MKYTLEAPFKSISGTIERKRLRDGRVITIYARKDGVIATRTYYPRGTVGRWSRDGRGADRLKAVGGSHCFYGEYMASLTRESKIED